MAKASTTSVQTTVAVDVASISKGTRSAGLLRVTPSNNNVDRRNLWAAGLAGSPAQQTRYPLN